MVLQHICVALNEAKYLLVTDIKSGSTLGLFGFFRPNKSTKMAFSYALKDGRTKNQTKKKAPLLGI